jgi:hypothetical protein
MSLALPTGINAAEHAACDQFKGPAVTSRAFATTKVGDVLLGNVLCPALHAADFESVGILTAATGRSAVVALATDAELSQTALTTEQLLGCNSRDT